MVVEGLLLDLRPLGLRNLLEDLLSHLDPLLRVQLNQIVCGLTVYACLVLKQFAQIVTNVSSRLQTQNSDIKQTLILRLGS